MKTLREAFLITESILFWTAVLSLAVIFQAGMIISELLPDLFVHQKGHAVPVMGRGEPTRA